MKRRKKKSRVRIAWVGVCVNLMLLCCRCCSDDCKSLVVATYRHALALKKSEKNMEHEK